MSDSVAIISGVSGRYASAIFDLGKESDCLEDFERDMMRLAKTLQESEDFRNLLRSPLYKRSEQENAIVQICDKLGCEKNTRNLLCLMARRRRLSVLPRVIEDFKLLLEDARGEIRVEVVAFDSLASTQKDDIEKVVAKSAGKKVKLETKIDKSIIGGLIIRIGSKMIDYSVRSKLLKLQTIMKEGN